MTAACKRPKPEPEEIFAECPFEIEHPGDSPISKETKKRRPNEPDADDPPTPMTSQISPFVPRGKFKSPDENMNRLFRVTPSIEWDILARYNKFQLHDVYYPKESFIFVANGLTIKRQRDLGEREQPQSNFENDWVARILDIRASDKDHVYVRVYWMYSPDDLPLTHDGKREVQGRQPYHGRKELIASNHMDIINAVSVTGPAKVDQWDETNKDAPTQDLYWRQAINLPTLELSSAKPCYKCGRPKNPDQVMISCTNETVQQSTDVEPDVQRADVNRSMLTNSTDQRNTGTILVSDITPPTARKKRGRPRKSNSVFAKMQTYDELFSARVPSNPPLIGITDERKGITDGETTRTESIKCLVCHQDIQ